ncbi:hypothetical protein PCIT_a0222 [Pseudoalteromonas citrea]|nr:hypothetical protein PCIT_a0222 [Pseudoalteromonas citrea]
MLRIVLIVSTFITLSGCSDAAPVPVSECAKVVAHAKKILGDKAPSTADMTKQCKEASDEARGCVLTANKAMKILNCDM